MRLGILTSGGPAPGFNGVIESAVRAATRRGWTVVGIPRGYSQLIAESLDECKALSPANVDREFSRGGSMLGTNRANPRKDPASMAAVIASVKKLKLDGLITIGGDDTATAAMSVGEELQKQGVKFRVAHVPKTIDNDLPLPGMAPTFGFETAKHLGSEICQNLRNDAITTGRWYLVTAMGRSAGHLALGMATGSGADLCIIREEFGDTTITVAQLRTLITDAIEIRTKEGQVGGLVVLGEGILEKLDQGELAAIANLELDEHGNPRMSEVDLGKALAEDIVKRGSKVKFITKLVGYELRCADPIAFDIQYTRALGAAAIDFIATGSGNGIVAIHEGMPLVMRFEEIRDSKTNRVPVRRVDLRSSYWTSSLQLQARK